MPIFNGCGEGQLSLCRKDGWWKNWSKVYSKLQWPGFRKISTLATSATKEYPRDANEFLWNAALTCSVILWWLMADIIPFSDLEEIVRALVALFEQDGLRDIVNFNSVSGLAFR